MSVSRGDKFNIVRTTQFGKEIKETVTVVAVIKNTVMMDNGKSYHLAQF